jgi:muramoyltetrapeptide carboxypeptidase
LSDVSAKLGILCDLCEIFALFACPNDWSGGRGTKYKMTTPQYLSPGDKIAIVSPARKISREEVADAIKVFKSWNLEVVEGEHVYDTYHQFAGTDRERTADLQRMLDDPAVKAIICSRGGYGTVRIIDHLDFTQFIKTPKWIVGYSDVTVLHSHIHRQFSIETLHAVMPINFKGSCDTKPCVGSLKVALFGKPLNYRLPVSDLCRRGIAEGELVGGNLSILYSLSNTDSDINTDGKILFLEDLDEYLYHIDRMMMNLKRSGKLENLAGLIVGGMTDMRDNEVPFGKSGAQIVADMVGEYDYPVFHGFPAGHQQDNRALFLGRRVKFEVGEEMTITF